MIKYKLLLKVLALSSKLNVLWKQNEINSFARIWLTKNFIYLQDTNERLLQTMEKNKRQQNLGTGYDLEKGILFGSTDFIRLSNEIIRLRREWAGCNERQVIFSLGSLETSFSQRLKEFRWWQYFPADRSCMRDFMRLALILNKTILAVKVSDGV